MDLGNIIDEFNKYDNVFNINGFAESMTDLHEITNKRNSEILEAVTAINEKYKQDIDALETNISIMISLHKKG